MKRLGLASLFFLLSCDQTADRNCGTLAMPPAQYRGDKVAARIIWAPLASIDGRCKALGTVTNFPGVLLACTGRDALGWYHVMPSDSPVRDVGCLLIHEAAHLPPNPWPWNHPGAIYQ